MHTRPAFDTHAGNAPGVAGATRRNLHLPGAAFAPVGGGLEQIVVIVEPAAIKAVRVLK